MALDERSLADILRDIMRNLQEIVRSEVRLAKTEIADEAARAKSAVVLVAAGAATALFAAVLLLLTIVFALTLIVPVWAAMLIPGTTLALGASVLLSAGMKRFRRRRLMPERKRGRSKEIVTWAQQQSK